MWKLRSLRKWKYLIFSRSIICNGCQVWVWKRYECVELVQRFFEEDFKFAHQMVNKFGEISSTGMVFCTKNTYCTYFECSSKNMAFLKWCRPRRWHGSPALVSVVNWYTSFRTPPSSHFGFLMILWILSLTFHLKYDFTKELKCLAEFSF